MIKNIIIAVLFLNSVWLSYKVVNDAILQFQLRKAFDEANTMLEEYMRLHGHTNGLYKCKLKQ
jgi:hypothetical protein